MEIIKIVLNKKILKINITQEPISQRYQVLSQKAMYFYKIKRKSKMIWPLLINIQDLIKTTLKKVNILNIFKSKIFKIKINNKKLTNLKECYINKINHTHYKKGNKF